ncbi:alpha-D-ribose 1-methylphosphonate 5-triphosphate diphosphatase [Rhodobacteraceae bacterium NNCM2]|nr:alpha-D-ribose 1-methylphosphonate 5-triphosphate diphosphatase [Coraliihabitans acroporae]
MTEWVLANAKLVLEDEVLTGSLVIRDGVIADISTGAAAPTGATDCGGDHVCPGLIELHTDNLERHMQPRPGVHWPVAAAILAHDAELASVGITTVFDALRVGSIHSGEKAKYGKYARETASRILEHRAAGNLRISHFLHLRAEICSETLVDEMAEFTGEDRIGIVSLMDHTPGQRQFRDLSKLAEYLVGKYAMSEQDLEDHYNHRYDIKERLGALHEAEAVARGKALGAVLASHDDTTEGDVAVSAGYGVGLAEFPTTLEAAKACHENGIAVIMGAPNLLRGGSHSGNVAASELADQGLLDIMSSDYAPSSLMMAAVKLGLDHGDMAEGIRMVTRNPARATGLGDRGVIAPGQRADLVRFGLAGTLPVIRQVWSQGHPA